MKIITKILAVLITLTFVPPVFAQETNYTYTNQEQDKSGLLHYDSRYYDPELGRFLQPDPVDIPNKYAYVSNDPVNYTDPTGHFEAPFFIDLSNTYVPDWQMDYGSIESTIYYIEGNWPDMDQDYFSLLDSWEGVDVVETVFQNQNGLYLSDSAKNSYSDFRKLLSDKMTRELRGPNTRRIQNKAEVIKSIVENYTILKHIGPAAKDFSLNLVGGNDNSMYPTFRNGDILLTENFSLDSKLPNLGLQKDDIIRVKTSEFTPDAVKRVHGFQTLGKEFRVILYTDNQTVNVSSPISPSDRRYYNTVNITDINGIMRLLLRDGKWQNLPPKPY